MPDIILHKTQAAPLTDAQRHTLREALYAVVDGLGPEHQQRWRRLWNRLLRSQPGELLVIHAQPRPRGASTARPRHQQRHQQHMALEARLFTAQQKFSDWHHFRTWLKIGAGHVDWLPGPKGGVIPVARSLSPASLQQAGEKASHQADQASAEGQGGGEDRAEAALHAVHTRMLAFLRTPHAQRVLWPGLNPAERRATLEALLSTGHPEAAP